MEAKPQESSNYFDIKNLDEITGLETHISFAEELIHKYDWDFDTKARFLSQLEQIKIKQQDKLLNLTVVGEFSTGKSTFINAMLRQDDFLVSSALQGTTVAATIIEYSEKCSIELVNNIGEQKCEDYDSVGALKKGLVEYTSDPSVAKELRSVKIKLPAAPLTAGFRIVDTPGTNVEEQWHEDVTIRTIREISDMAILIIDANKPLPQTFRDFVKENLSDMLHNCIFVATRIDMIRSREREGVLNYLKEEISAEFGIANPIVFPYASIEVLDSLNLDEPSALAMQSFKSESQMLYHMSRLKMIAQTQKVISLIGSLYVAISEKMQVISKGYKDELNYLLKTKQTDLAPFINSQIRRTQEMVDKKTEEQFNDDLRDFIVELQRIAYFGVMNRIDSCTSIEALKTFSNSELSSVCQRECQNIVGQLTKKVNYIIDTAFKSAMIKFQTEFEKLFKDLNILKVDFNKAGYTAQTATVVPAPRLTAISNYIDEQLSNENKAFFGSAATGAAIGTAIAPGIGTLIGGIIGFVGGSLFAPQIDDVKNNFKKTLHEPLCNAIDQATQTAIDNCENYRLEVLNNYITREINKYLKTYQKIVSSQILEEEKKIASIERKVLGIQFDIDSISERKFALQSLNNQLNSLGGEKI